MLLLILLAAAAAPSVATTPAIAPNPRVAELFEREPLLMRWALKRFDANGDGWLTMFEAQRAADGFRALADNDHDGRVTTTEYRDAIAFIAARY